MHSDALAGSEGRRLLFTSAFPPAASINSGCPCARSISSHSPPERNRKHRHVWQMRWWLWIMSRSLVCLHTLRPASIVVEVDWFQSKEVSDLCVFVKCSLEFSVFWGLPGVWGESLTESCLPTSREAVSTYRALIRDMQIVFWSFIGLVFLCLPGRLALSCANQFFYGTKLLILKLWLLQRGSVTEG